MLWVMAQASSVDIQGDVRPGERLARWLLSNVRNGCTTPPNLRGNDMSWRTLGICSNFLTLLACAGADGAEELGLDDGVVGDIEQSIYVHGTYLWNKTDLSVCWESTATSTVYARSVVQSAVEIQWGKATGLRFTGWGACTSSGADIRIKANDDQSAVAAAGSAMQNMKDGMVLNMKYEKWGNRCSCSDAGKAHEATIRTNNPTWTDPQVYAQCVKDIPADACIYSVAVHEFGHAIGLFHEQNRGDHTYDDTASPACGPQGWGSGVDPLDIFLGPPNDLTSVMNYCNSDYNNYGLLSDSDARGVRLLYGWGTDQPVPGSFTGGDAELAIWRPSTGTWWRVAVGATGGVSKTWGVRGDIALSGDYDGDGKADMALYRPSNQTWWVRDWAGDNLVYNMKYGARGDIPVAGDFDGGGTDIAFWRPSTGKWYAKDINGAVIADGILYGEKGDVPVVGDYDGDELDDLALWRPSTGVWYGRKVTGGKTIPSGTTWGSASSVPLTGDFDGDGKNDLATFNGGTFRIKPSTGLASAVTLGDAHDIPVVADFDGDGKDDIGRFSPDLAEWRIRRSANGSTVTQAFGAGKGYKVKDP